MHSARLPLVAGLATLCFVLAVRQKSQIPRNTPAF
jgi:hypothetical protein